MCIVGDNSPEYWGTTTGTILEDEGNYYWAENIELHWRYHPRDCTGNTSDSLILTYF